MSFPDTALKIEDRTASPHAAARLGFFCGAGAYLWWGFIAVYFKLVADVPPIQILSHRIVWSLVLVLLLTAWRGEWAELRAAVTHRKTLLMLAASTAMLTINWFTFIIAITNNHVMQASLGYFINPLVNVLLGMIFLHEHLRRWQAVALVLAAAGVAWLTWSAGQMPWLALTLAVTFGFYGLLRKTAPVGSIAGLTVETAFLLPLALVFIILRHAGGATYSPGTWSLLMLAGIVTAVPLLLFAAGARRLRLATMGFLQYLAPTCQFLLAVLAFNEPFTKTHLVSFSLIWFALLVYSWDSYSAYRAGQAAPSAAPEP